jgi:hypothetical protein
VEARHRQSFRSLSSSFPYPIRTPRIRMFYKHMSMGSVLSNACEYYPKSTQIELAIMLFVSSCPLLFNVGTPFLRLFSSCSCDFSSSIRSCSRLVARPHRSHTPKLAAHSLRHFVRSCLKDCSSFLVTTIAACIILPK